MIISYVCLCWWKTRYSTSVNIKWSIGSHRPWASTSTQLFRSKCLRLACLTAVCLVKLDLYSCAVKSPSHHIGCCASSGGYISPLSLRSVPSWCACCVWGRSKRWCRPLWPQRSRKPCPSCAVWQQCWREVLPWKPPLEQNVKEGVNAGTPRLVIQMFLMVGWVCSLPLAIRATTAWEVPQKLEGALSLAITPNKAIGP